MVGKKCQCAKTCDYVDKTIKITNSAFEECISTMLFQSGFTATSNTEYQYNAESEEHCK